MTWDDPNATYTVNDRNRDGLVQAYAALAGESAPQQRAALMKLVDIVETDLRDAGAELPQMPFPTTEVQGDDKRTADQFNRLVDQLASLREGLQGGIDALEGDSNDAEHEALYELVGAMQGVLETAGVWKCVEIKSPYEDDEDDEGARPYTCRACGRPELECSANPCPQVVTDRGESDA